MLMNLKRHPDFRYQFLSSDFVPCSDQCNQERFNAIYEFIKDKLDYSISQNSKLNQLVAPYSSMYQVSKWWSVIQEYFLPTTEFAKQQREVKFMALRQKPNETNLEFILRVKLEAEILEFVDQEVSESRLRLAIATGLTTEFQRTMAQLNKTPLLEDWILYIKEMELVETSKSVPVVSAIYKPTTRNLQTPVTQSQKFKQLTTKRAEVKNSSNRNSYLSKAICYHCESLGHMRNDCPHLNDVDTVKLNQLRQKNRRERSSANKIQSVNTCAPTTKKQKVAFDKEDNLQRQFQRFKDLSVSNANMAALLSTSSADDDVDMVVGMVTETDNVIRNIMSKEVLLFLQEPSKPKLFNNPIFDSGATRHMFNNLAHFSNFQPNTNVDLQVEVAEGSRIPILGKGVVGLLKNVLYIPSLRFSIISISVLDILHYSILFHEGSVNIFDTNNNVFLTGIRNNYGLYVVGQQEMEKSFSITPITCVVHQFSTDPYLKVHACLGHASAKRTRYVCRCNKIKGIESLSVNSFKSILNCEACKIAKAKRRSFPGHFEVPAIAGASWQFDVKGRIEVPSVLYNAHYEFGFIDLHSRKLFTYYATNKDSITTTAVISIWFPKVIVPLRVSDKSLTKVFIHSDLGELKSDLVTAFCDHNGLYPTFTAGYTPQLNCFIERVWRTITDSAIAM